MKIIRPELFVALAVAVVSGVVAVVAVSNNKNPSTHTDLAHNKTTQNPSKPTGEVSIGPAQPHSITAKPNSPTSQSPKPAVTTASTKQPTVGQASQYDGRIGRGGAGTVNQDSRHDDLVSLVKKGGGNPRLRADIKSGAGQLRPGLKAARERLDRDRASGSPPPSGPVNNGASKRIVDPEALRQPLLVKVKPGYGRPGKMGRVALELVVRNRQGPKELLLVVKHSEQLLAQRVVRGPVTQATDKQILIQSKKPGKTVLMIRGGSRPLSSGELGSIEFAVSKKAPRQSPIFISYAGITGEPDAAIAMLGDTMHVQ